MNAVLKPLELQMRPMTESDLDEVIRVVRAAYPYPWTRGNFRDCLESGYSCWLAEIDSRIAGYWLMMQAVGLRPISASAASRRIGRDAALAACWWNT